MSPRSRSTRWRAGMESLISSTGHEDKGYLGMEPQCKLLMKNVPHRGLLPEQSTPEKSSRGTGGRADCAPVICTLLTALSEVCHHACSLGGQVPRTQLTVIEGRCTSTDAASAVRAQRVSKLLNPWECIQPKQPPNTHGLGLLFQQCWEQTESEAMARG